MTKSRIEWRCISCGFPGAATPIRDLCQLEERLPVGRDDSHHVGDLPQGWRRHVSREEMKVVFDAKGGYWQSGGRFMQSVIAEMGTILERHMKSIGLIKSEEMDPARDASLAEKRAQYEAQQGASPSP